ncbi:MAG: hypothetical protein WCR06_04375 [bacterium]
MLVVILCGITFLLILIKDELTRIYLLKYVIALVTGSFIVATIQRISGGGFPLLIIAFVLFICLGVFLTVLMFNYFRRLFLARVSGARVVLSVGLAIVSAALSFPLSVFFIDFFYPYRYGPGP